jgi:hypothetical protein
MGTTRTTYKWVPEAIRKYTPLYKGRRYWIFLNNPEDPFDGWTKDSDIIAYDLEFDGILAVGNYNKNGSIDGCYMGGQGVTFIADNPRDMIGECLGIMKWYY